VKRTKDTKISDDHTSELRDLRTTTRNSLRGLRKFFDEPRQEGGFQTCPYSRFFLAPFAFFAAILLFGCGFAALSSSW
jgi:hypothetical protein